MMRLRPCSLARATADSAACRNSFGAVSPAAPCVNRDAAAHGHVFLRRARMMDLLFAHAMRDRGGVLDHVIGLGAVHEHDDAGAFPAADDVRAAPE